MVHKMTLTICLIGSCIWCMALVTRADSAQNGAGGDTFKPVSEVEALMYGQRTFYKRIQKILKKDTLSGKRARELEKSSQVLAELANVNRFNRSETDYRNWATKLRDTALQLAKEAEKKDAADITRMRTLLMTLHETCESCHDVYQEEED